ncbi:hypothetical protein PQU96_15880 [Vogesella sp. LYT5W]|uniref:Restriction endonuclease n=1 Tax=Vogesella margarita TaxID=2984199 RepID=A0ABT5ITJ6_9NEIS|nr:hypothetical protein [Vogesella margarita]MDC7715595.1 hypothetical protein [Vogesella margarita]
MKFSVYFNINKSQSELDFVDIPLDTDIPLFIDPYALINNESIWHQECAENVQSYFLSLIESIKHNDTTKSWELLSHLSEPRETHLGLSSGKSNGKGIGGFQAKLLHEKLKSSEAVKSGMLSSISELELMIDGVGHDKISDLTTNLIRHQLIEYTQNQCKNYAIEMQNVPSGFYWDTQNEKWAQCFTQLPVANGEKIILVPKTIVCWTMSVNHQEYYQHFVLNFLQEHHINIHSSLVKLLKDGTPKVTKKSLKEEYPLTKEFLFEFTKKYPAVIERYRDDIKFSKPPTDFEITSTQGDDFDITKTASKLKNIIKSIEEGKSEAYTYQDAMLCALLFIFGKNLVSPKLEREIHDGRKRIDITFLNNAKDGFFYRALKSPRLNAVEISFECKNYSSDPKNPELDQLAGRFSPNRGWVGFILARKCTNKSLFEKRCKDTFLDGRGLIIPLYDEDIFSLLDMASTEDYMSINSMLDDIYRKISS